MNTNVYAPPTAKLESNQKACQECGEIINQKAEICPKCGVRQKGIVNKTVLLLLTFFGGGIGLHKFYLRKPVQGVFYLLFFWLWIPGLIALIEFIVYAFTSEERLNEKYEATSSAVAIIIGVIAIFALLAIIGILAAISIPAYQEYTHRAKLSAVLGHVEPLRAKVESHIVKTGAVPATAAEVPDAAPLKIDNLGVAQLEHNGVIVVRFDAALGRTVAGTTMEFTPRLQNGQLAWSCTGGTLPARFRPVQCRGG